MKIKQFLLTTIALVWILMSASSVFAAAVEPMSSGIKNQFYSLEWCSPHYKDLQSNWSNSCRIGFFQNVGGVAKVVYNGQDFPTGNVSADIDPTKLSTTKTSQTLSALTAYINFFTNTTGGAFAIEGEWVVTIRTYITDYADNTSFYKVTYKIDKTAPQLSFAASSITETTPYTHYEWTVNADLMVTKNDSASATSTNTATNPVSYQNPILSSYVGNSALPRSAHTRTSLPAFYFKNSDTTPFVLNSVYSDTYGGYLTSSATPSVADGYSGPLTSWEKEFQLLTADSLPAGMGNYVQPASNAVSYANANLINNTENTQAKYRLRLYDNTVDASGQPGNYSETAFYVARDNTLPNMGGNGLAVTKTDAIERIMKFDTSITAWDKTTTAPLYNPETPGVVSKFIAANTAQPLYSSLSDIGIGSASSPDLYNAGLDKANLKVEIEQAATVGAYDTTFTYPNRFANANLNQLKNFSNVDIARSSGYRNYTTRMTGGSLPWICDLVGNCLDPKLNFRVVASTLSPITSTISLETKSQSSAGKIFANGLDSYRLSYTLKDWYGNKIVPVKSKENSGTPQIKTVDSIANFQNGLNADQRSDIASGDKLAVVNDLETDNNTATFSDTINTAGAVSMRENVNTSTSLLSDGQYTLELKSKVPTKGFYPYISDNSVLRVSSIANIANINATNDITYPGTGDRIGSFNTVSNGGVLVSPTTDFVVANTGAMGETTNFMSFNLNENDYGKVSLQNNMSIPFANFANRRTNIEFASPFIYGLDGMTMGSLTNNSYVTHTKKLFSLSNLSDPKIYEKILVAYRDDNKGIDTNGKDGQPGILDFNLRRNSTSQETSISPGFCNGASCENIFLTGGTPNPLTLTITGGTSMQTAMVPIASLLPYIDANIHRGFVSAITYDNNGDTIKLPSVARDINNNAGSYLDQFQMTRNYFADNYALGYSALRVQDTAKVLTDIAITGLSNRYNGITTSTGGTKANVNIGNELTRFDLVTSIKKNVALLSAGFGPSTDTSGKHWCTGVAINQAFMDVSSGPAVNCTQTINGETISFIDGNSTIDCGTSNCNASGKRSIVVKNGSLYVKSNITTLDASGTQTAGQFFLGVMNEAGLVNVEIATGAQDITLSDKKGWLFIDPTVTNIDSFLFSQWPMVSYSDKSTYNEFYSLSSNKSDRQLRNQLHIMGSLLTLNNIGESTTPKCPYIVSNCSLETAPIFDLINFRNFKFTSLSTYTWDPADNLTMSPYYPGPLNSTAKISGGTTESREPAGTGDVACASWSDLRCITDRDYRGYPMLIERDLRWNSSPSALFKVNN